MGSNDSKQLHVEFYTRSYMPDGAEDSQRRILERLNHLHERGILDSCECHIWGKRVPTSMDRPEWFDNDAIETVGQFRAWAEHNGVSLLPFFDERTQESKITGEEYSEIVFPIMCMAVYREGDLTGVYPHADDDSTVTIDDYLSKLVPNNSETPEQPGTPLA